MAALLRCFLFIEHMCAESFTELYTVVGVLFCRFMTGSSEDCAPFRYRMEARTDVDVGVLRSLMTSCALFDESEREGHVDW